jgi:Rrf2 family protein
MDRILAISDRCNAAIHALALAAAGGRGVTVAVAAERLGLSRSYLAKVLQVLSRRGMLRSTRGAAGGYELARDPSAISCLEIVEVLEGPLPERDCLFETSVCDRKGCAIKVLCRKASKAARQALESTSVAAIAAGFKATAKEGR